MYVTEAMIMSMEEMQKSASDMEKHIKGMMETEARMHDLELDSRHNARDMWHQLSEHMSNRPAEDPIMEVATPAAGAPETTPVEAVEIDEDAPMPDDGVVHSHEDGTTHAHEGGDEPHSHDSTGVRVDNVEPAAPTVPDSADDPASHGQS